MNDPNHFPSLPTTRLASRDTLPSTHENVAQDSGRQALIQGKGQDTNAITPAVSFE